MKILRDHSNPVDAPKESHVKFGLHLFICLYIIHTYFTDLSGVFRTTANRFVALFWKSDS